ncbi:DMT family transporter [Oceanobacillus sp. Castelsardo]|uniref:DMT family transporter n=1 Tax=Oceanobacillus sp. Castelsardo TaxID=1851204 RepID=UPI0008396D11|nr:DMT family transporter [Oceanobacillus sp. Castelsardo]
MRIPPFNPYIAIIIGVIAVSSTPIFVKLANGVPSAIIANYRLLLAVLIMSPIILSKYRKEFRYINRRNWILAIISGVFLATHFLLWFESLNYTSITSSIILITIHPIFVFIGTYFLFQERFSSGSIISLIIILFGSAIIGWGDFGEGNSFIYGDLLAILASISLAIYVLTGQKTRKNLSLITYTYIVYGVGMITLFLYNIIMQNSFGNYSMENWYIFLALAIIPTFFGHSLFNWAMKWLSNSTVSMAIVFEPIAATFLAYIVLRETMIWSQLLGGTIIVFGLFLFILSTSRKNSVTIAKKRNKQF